MKEKLVFLIKIPIGLVLYLLSPSFRAAVKRKLRGIDDTIAGGEKVVAVLTSEANKEVIE